MVVVSRRGAAGHFSDSFTEPACSEAVAPVANGLDVPVMRLKFAPQFLDVDVNRSFGDRRTQGPLDQFGAAKHAPGLGRQNGKEPELCWRENDFAVTRLNAEALGKEMELGIGRDGVHGMSSGQVS